LAKGVEMGEVARGASLFDAGFVDDAGEFFDDGPAVEFGGFVKINEGEVGVAEDFGEGLGIVSVVAVGAINSVAIRRGTGVELDGADWAEGALVTEDEVDGLVGDEAIGFVAILVADFVAEEGGDGNIGDDVKTVAEDVVEELKTASLMADHELFAGAIVETFECGALAATG